jgi:hypothetical protein
VGLELSAQGERRYKAFHGRPPRFRKRIAINPIRELVLLGDAVEIVYRSNKLHGGGDGKLAEYEHKFARGTKLYCTPDGKHVLLIHGPKLKVEEPGIIN